MVNWNNKKEVKEYYKQYNRQYNDKHKDKRKQYNKEHQMEKQLYNKHYYKMHKEKHNSRRKQYRKEHYDDCSRRSAKARSLGFELLIPNPYKNTNIEWEWHHIDNIQVIAIPTSLHKRYANNQYQVIHQQMVNAWVEIIYGIKIDR
jgi:hypothetical protein